MEYEDEGEVSSLNTAQVQKHIRGIPASRDHMSLPNLFHVLFILCWLFETIIKNHTHTPDDINTKN